MPRTTGLTAKQRRFVTEYLIDSNATQAAIRAGYSPKTAAWIGPQLLGKTHVKLAIHDAEQVQARRNALHGDRVLAELAIIAFSDVTHYQVDEANQLILSPDAPPTAMRAVASIKRKTRIIPQKDGEPIIDRELEFRLWDKNTALTNLGKHFKLFVERFEVVGPLLSEIQRLANARGLTPEQVIAEAEAIAAGRA